MTGSSLTLEILPESMIYKAVGNDRLMIHDNVLTTHNLQIWNAGVFLPVRHLLEPPSAMR
jgi:hypothetical protein